MNFKKYLNEYSKYWETDKEWAMAARLFMPLSDSVMKKFITYIPETYHVCSLSKLPLIQHYENKKHQISTFTKGSMLLSYGAESKTECLLVLTGEGIPFNADLGTYLDRNGKRWIAHNKSHYDGWDFIWQDFSIPMVAELEKFFEKEGIEVNELDEIYDVIKKSDGKLKSRFVKFYYDKSKEILQRNFKSIQSKFISSGTSTNNEIVLVKYKIYEYMPVINNDEQLEQLIKECPKARQYIEQSDIKKIDLNKGKGVYFYSKSINT